MDQVKTGSKTLFDFFFQASSTEKYKSNKGLDFSTPAPSTNDPSYATSSSEIGELHYFHRDEIKVEQLSRIKMTRQTKN